MPAGATEQLADGAANRAAETWRLVAVPLGTLLLHHDAPSPEVGTAETAPTSTVSAEVPGPPPAESLAALDAFSYGHRAGQDITDFLRPRLYLPADQVPDALQAG